MESMSVPSASQAQVVSPGCASSAASTSARVSAKKRRCQVQVDLWDIDFSDAQDYFLGKSSKGVCQDADGVLLVCDANKPITREEATNWKTMIQAKVHTRVASR